MSSETLLPNNLTLSFEETQNEKMLILYRHVSSSFEDSQRQIHQNESMENTLSTKLPEFIPDIWIQSEDIEGGASVQLYVSATGRQIGLEKPTIQSFDSHLAEIEEELKVPKRKNRVALYSDATSLSSSVSNAIAYVSARVRSFEESLSKHPAIQLEFGGGVHTNIMVDTHIDDETLENIFRENQLWDCSGRIGGKSAQFYSCQVPNFNHECLSESSRYLQSFERTAFKLRKVDVPLALQSYRDDGPQKELDQLMLGQLNFETSQKVCLISGCYRCTFDGCEALDVESFFVPLDSHDTAWRMCSDVSFGPKYDHAVVCLRLKMGESQKLPIVSLHSEACKLKSPSE